MNRKLLHEQYAQTCDMIGQLHIDVLPQSKYLLTCVIMSNAAHVLMVKGDCPDCKIEILAVKLYVGRLRITPSLCLVVNKFLQNDTTKYPNDTRGIHEQKSFSHDNLFMGQLSKRIVLGSMDNTAFIGNYTL